MQAVRPLQTSSPRHSFGPASSLQAVLLAAGEGRRLRPITDTTPKPMVKVGGKPILEHTLEALPPEVGEAILVIGYKGEMIREYFGNSYGGIALSYAEQDAPRGTGHALGVARPHLKDGHFLMLGGDDLFHPDDMRACAASETPVVLVSRSPSPERFGVCLLDENGNLREMLEKRPNPPSNLVSTGAFLLNHEIFDEPPAYLPNGEHNLAEQVGNWAKRRPVAVVESRFWHPVNNLDELAEAEEILKRMKNLKKKQDFH